MVFWHPKGWSIWQQVEQYMRRVYQRQRLPGSALPADPRPRRCGRSSGHWENYKDNMFTTESEKRDFAVKPMNCPGHIQIFNSDLRSYRDLPLRYGEFGACHRNEPSGALHGIMRVRGFTQDDGHIFCTEEQIQPEVRRVHTGWRMEVYRDFGFNDVAIKIALRPTSALGADATWDSAENALRDALRACGVAVDGAAGRRRVLRPEDRIPPQGFDRALLAVRHDAGRFPDARPPGRRIRGRGQRAQGAGDAAPRDRRLDGALHRHPDRASRRRVAACGWRRVQAVVLNITDRPGRLCRAGRRRA